MNLIIKILIFVIMFDILNFASVSNKIPVTIVKIYDGDTVLAKIGNNQFPIRLIGIDCYETKKIHRAYTQAYQNNLPVDEVVCKGQKY